MNSSAGASATSTCGSRGVHADVASTPPLLAQHLRKLVRIGEGLAENQSAPTEFDDYIVGHSVDHVRRRRIMQAERDGLGVILVGIDIGGVAGRPAPVVMPRLR